MAEAYYPAIPATDSTLAPVPGADFQVFEIADTTFSTPLSLRVGSGNPTTTVKASDTLATLPGVYVTSPNFEHIWKSGTFEWRRDSIDGAKAAIEDAKVSASNSAASAASSAALVDAPADTVIKTLFSDSATQTRIEVDGLYATGQKVASVANALPGSKKSGNLRVGAKSVTLANTGHNAFPGFAVLTDGGYISVWRSAPQHDPTPTAGVIKARKFDADGTPRGDAYTVLTDTLDLRDPMLTRLSDGRLVMQFFKHDGTSTTIAGVWVAISTDEGTTFTVRSKVPFTWDTLAACAGKVTVTASGEWLVAAYGRMSNTFNHIRLMRSSDEGVTWTGEITVAEGQVESRNYVEPVIGLLPDGQTLMCLIRVADSTGTNPAIYRTTSTDNGLTWTAETNIITAAGGRPAWTRLASGGVVLVYRSTVAPYPMQVRTSWDNGVTWSAANQIGPTPNSQGAYAQPVEVARGLVGVVYAIEFDVLSGSTLYFGYLADGLGATPLGDTDSALASLFKGAAEGSVVGGAPTLGHIVGWGVWSLSDSAADQIGITFQIPTDWAKFDVSILWANPSTGTGDVSFRHDMEQVSPNGTLTSVAGVTAVVPAGGQYILKETVAATGVTRTGDFIRVKPTRIGSATADTLVGTIGIIGVKLTRAT